MCCETPRHEFIIYRPPPSKKNRLSVSDFFKEWDKFLENCATFKDDFFLILGDLNFHLDKVSDPCTTRFLNLLSGYGFQHITESTHVKGHILDVAITRKSCQQFKDFRVLDPGLCNTKGVSAGDHLAVCLNMNVKKPDTVTVKTTYRKYKSINLSSFQSSIKASVVGGKLSSLSEDLVANYNNVLKEILDKHAPQMERKVVLRPQSPWYNTDLEAAKRLKRKLERKWLMSKLTLDLQIYRDKCAKLNKLCSITRRIIFQIKWLNVALINVPCIS